MINFEIIFYLIANLLIDLIDQNKIKNEFLNLQNQRYYFFISK